MASIDEHPAVPDLASLYEADETAWLERMAELASVRRLDEMDFQHLAEYLSDMAIRDRRQVENRLTTLLMHLLKWEHQSAKRSTSRELTIFNQRRRLTKLIDARTLKNHAIDALQDSYGDAVRGAMIETKLPEETFPPQCPYTLDEILGQAGDLGRPAPEA